jgi:hypothetical protein
MAREFGLIERQSVKSISSSTPTILPLTALIILTVTIGLGLIPSSRPAASAASAPLQEFSSERARAHVVHLAKTPRMMGTAEHELARDYIVAELKRLNLAPEVQNTCAVRVNERGWAMGGNVQNVAARIRGAGGGRAILLSAHYDSVAMGPGAADDASGVAVLLETARVLTTGTPLADDVILLFTDGEEYGLVGAEAFVSQHKWARDVGVALNFEARGSAGPVYLFETSSPNGKLIHELSRSVAYPTASSLFYEIYRILPNDTDLTVFRRAGYGGMNFAFVDKVIDYHTPEDTEQNLDSRSLQQSGLYAVSMTRALGNDDLHSGPDHDLIYFSIVGSGLLTYPSSLALPLSVVALVLTICALALALSRKRVSTAAVLFGLLAVPSAAALAGGAAMVVARIVQIIRPDFAFFFMGDIYSHWAFLAAEVVAGGALAAVALGAMLRRWAPFGMWLGALLWASAAHLALANSMPGASYLFAWPHLASAVCALIVALSDRSWQSPQEGAEPQMSPFGTILTLAGSSVWVVFLAGLFRLLPKALGLGAGLPLALLFALLACWLIPFLAQIPKVRGAAVLGATAAAAAVLVVVGSAENRYDSRQPLQAAIFYGIDADQGRAFWAARGQAAGSPWIQAHFGSNPATGPLPAFSLGDGGFTSGPAPLLSIPAPESEVRSTTPSASGRNRWTIRLRSVRGAPSVMLRLLKRDDSARLVSVNGHDATGSLNVGLRGVILRAARAKGDEIVIESAASGQPAFQMMDWTPGLPASAGTALTARPADITMGPEFDLYNWSTVVAKESRPTS